MTRSKRLLAIAGLLVATIGFLGPVHAEVDTRQARRHYDAASQQYNLGHFAEAIPEFEEAYKLSGDPIMLFNIAQCHRQMEAMNRALFFYRRYLRQLPPDSTHRADVEKLIKDIEAKSGTASPAKAEPAAEQTALPPAPPPKEQAVVPTAAPLPVVVAPEPGVVLPAEARTAARRRFRADVELGFSAAHLNDRPVDMPTMFRLRASGRFGVHLPRVTIELGMAAIFSPLRYTKVQGTEHGMSTLLGALAELGVRYPVGGGLQVAGQAGAGIIWWSGLGDGNPFTVDSTATSGAVPLPSLRVAAEISYVLPRSRVVVFVHPALVHSWTTGELLTRAFSSLTTIDLLAGAGVLF